MDFGSPPSTRLEIRERGEWKKVKDESENISKLISKMELFLIMYHCGFTKILMFRGKLIFKKSIHRFVSRQIETFINRRHYKQSY